MADCVHRPLHEGTIAIVSTLLLGLVLSAPAACATSQKSDKPQRPQIPFGFTALSPVEVGIYDSKAQPAAEALQAVNAMTLKAWEASRSTIPNSARDRTTPARASILPTLRTGASTPSL